MSRDISIKCMYWLTTACSVSILHSGCREYKKKKKIDGYSNLKKKNLKLEDGINAYKISKITILLHPRMFHMKYSSWWKMKEMILD